MSDPTDDPTSDAQARIRAAADQFGAALGDAFKLAMRQTLAKSIALDFGPGPWVLHPDGTVTPHLTDSPDPDPEGTQP